MKENNDIEKTSYAFQIDGAVQKEVNYSDIEDKVISKKIDEDGNLIVEALEFPQSSLKCYRLDENNWMVDYLDFESQKIDKPGFHKMFKVGEFKDNYINTIYQIGNDKYIYKNLCWYKIEPIMWIVDEKKGKAISKKIFNNPFFKYEISYYSKDKKSDIENILDEIRVYSVYVSIPNFNIEEEINKLLNDYNNNINKIKNNISDNNEITLNFDNIFILKSDLISKLEKIRDKLKTKYDNKFGFEKLSKSLEDNSEIVNELTRKINTIKIKISKINNSYLTSYFDTILSNFKSEVDNPVENYDKFYDNLMKRIDEIEEKLESRKSLIELLNNFNISKKKNIFKRNEINDEILKINKLITKYKSENASIAFNQFLEIENNKIIDIIFSNEEINMDNIYSIIINDLAKFLYNLKVIICKENLIDDYKDIKDNNKKDALNSYKDFLKNAINDLTDDIKNNANSKELEKLITVNIDIKNINDIEILENQYKKLVILKYEIDFRITKEKELDSYKIIG